MINQKQGNIMMFDREYFENILPVNKKTGDPLWEELIQYGERCYKVRFSYNPIWENTWIVIRSSIPAGAIFSDDCGENSIRIFSMTTKKDGSVQYSTKITRWITRHSGWETRMLEQLSLWRKLILAAGICPTCREPRNIWNGKNGVFAKCFDCGTAGYGLDHILEKKNGSDG